MYGGGNPSTERLRYSSTKQTPTPQDSIEAYQDKNTSKERVNSKSVERGKAGSNKKAKSLSRISGLPNAIKIVGPQATIRANPREEIFHRHRTPGTTDGTRRRNRIIIKTRESNREKENNTIIDIKREGLVSEYQTTAGRTGSQGQGTVNSFRDKRRSDFSTNNESFKTVSLRGPTNFTPQISDKEGFFPSSKNGGGTENQELLAISLP